MKLWQMIIILVLSLVMVVTMFLPAFRINGDAVKKMMENVTSGNALTEMVQDYVMEGMDEQFKEIDKAVKEYEEESNVKISKISPFRIMTHSLAKLIAGDKATEEGILKAESDETFGQMQKSYNKLRYLLWAVYGLLLVVMIIIVLGFLLKWNKIVPFAISAVYGLAAAVIFGYLRFGLMRSLAKKAGDAIE